MAEPTTPSSEEHARELLRDADLSTPAGRNQARAILDWATGRTISREFNSELNEAERNVTKGALKRFADTVPNPAMLASRFGAGMVEAIFRGLFEGPGHGGTDWSSLSLENLTAEEDDSGPTVTRRAWAAPTSDLANITGLSADALAARAGQPTPNARGVQPTGTQVEGGVDLQAAMRTPDQILGGPEAFDPTSARGGMIGPGGQAGSQFVPGLTEAYYQGDETTLLRRMPIEQRARLQDLLVATGLATSIVPGELDDGTVSGFDRLLRISNRSGERWQVTMDRLRRSAAQGLFGEEAGSTIAETPGYVEPPQLTPDPARLRLQARNAGREALGRDLDEDEIDFLHGALEDLEQQNYDRMVAVDRGEFDASIAAQTTGEDQAAVTGQEFGDAVVSSRFRELFEERYAPEIDMRGRAEMGRVVSDLVGRGGGLVANMTGGR